MPFYIFLVNLCVRITRGKNQIDFLRAFLASQPSPVGENSHADFKKAKIFKKIFLDLKANENIINDI